MKKALFLLSAVLLIAVMAIPVLAEFDLEDFTIPDTGVHFGFNGDAKDEFGNVTGELVGEPTFVEGRDGTANGAVYLDDDTQYILVGKYVDAESYTAIFWCKVEDNNEHVFLCSSMLGSIRIIHDDGVHVGSTINGVVDNISDYEAPRDEWVMLAFVYADENMDIYANGEYATSLSGALPLPFTLIGNEAAEQKGWQKYPFLTLDDAWFYGRAFSADEVKAMYTETGGTAAASSGGDINDGAVEVRGEYRFYEEQPEIKGECLVDVNSDMDEISGYRGEIGTDLFNLSSGGNGYCVKRDTCVWYDFEAPADGTYLFMIDYIARTGAERGVDWALDDPDGTNRHFIDLWETDVNGYVVSTFETTKGPHSFYVYAPTDMDDSTLKSCDTYWVYVYYIPDGLAAALPVVETPTAPEGYPASGESGSIMIGKVIGNETGWDGTEASGAASAFDGKAATFFDPLGVGDGFCGMEYDEPYILEKVAILSRSGWLDRFEGATIEGSNDGEEWEELWCSEEAAPSETEYNIITEFENNYGYKMYRYVNYTKHGDVAEVEFYGKPGTAERPAKEEEPAPAEEPKAEEPTAQEVVEQAADAVGEAVGEVAENVSEAAQDAAEAVSEAASDAAKKAGCGSFIGGGLIVLVTVLGSAWIAKRH